MTGTHGKGHITTLPDRKLRYLLLAHIVWMALVLGLGVWWTRLAHRLSGRIAELEKLLGMPVADTMYQWSKTQRMLHWESTTFIALLMISTGVLLWLYWRDWFRSRSLHAFFASVTHELRTPLTSIRLQAESLAESAQGPLVDRLIEDTMRLEAQVERTLELARIEGGGPLFVQALELQPILQQSIRHWKDAYKERIQVECDVDDTAIEADPTALQVILKNILENSMKHSAADPVKVRIRSRHENGQVRITFSDNGQPFSGDLKKLGRLFQKGAASRGAGVGLYLVSRLMSRMRGKVEFSATPVLEITLRFRDARAEGGRNGE